VGPALPDRPTGTDRLTMIKSARHAAREYDRLYAAAELVLKSANPCGFGESHATGGKCAGCPVANGRADSSSITREALCCTACKHHGPKGCRVKSLVCKLWLCKAAIKRSPAASDQLLALHHQAIRVFGWHWYWKNTRQSRSAGIRSALAPSR
jgi:hypothetical protein